MQGRFLHNQYKCWMENRSLRSLRNKLVFFAGRVQNSGIRQQLLNLWRNDTSFDIFSGHPSYPYEEGFRRSKYCLHVKGYEVNTARISDAIHYGCIPVLISNYYDLPFANILDWSKFSIIVNQADVALLKHILMSVSEQTYLNSTETYAWLGSTSSGMLTQ
ncbi:UNVERIFIED_CONTAM: putative glycosyltransferase [Sesamum calycinum]|uniref:Glycosyltransferase n=1 Tax=Sesamum calycinum TaxID=2727403 RepID=A0AAW2KTC5_9LAMI